MVQVNRFYESKLCVSVILKTIQNQSVSNSFSSNGLKLVQMIWITIILFFVSCAWNTIHPIVLCTTQSCVCCVRMCGNLLFWHFFIMRMMIKFVRSVSFVKSSVYFFKWIIKSSSFFSFDVSYMYGCASTEHLLGCEDEKETYFLWCRHSLSEAEYE